MVTQNYLLDNFIYNPETGEFKRRNGNKTGWVEYTKLKMYLRLSINYKKYHIHRLIFLYMTGEFPQDTIDHIDGDSLNNKWNNLRAVSMKVNNQNLGLFYSNKSGISGVWFNPKRQRWDATIKINEKTTHVYYGKDFFEACCARKSAENLHYNRCT